MHEDLERRRLQPNNGHQAIIELMIRTQRAAELIGAGAEDGLAEEAHALARIPIELHLNQLAIAYMPMPATELGDATRNLSLEERGNRYYTFGDWEKLRYRERHPQFGLVSKTQAQLDDLNRELRTRLSGTPWVFWHLDAKNRRRWHQNWLNLDLPSLASKVREHLPKWYGDHQTDKVFSLWPAVIGHANMVLHASPNGGSHLRKPSVSDPNRIDLVDHRLGEKEWAGLAGVLTLKSLTVACDTLGMRNLAQEQIDYTLRGFEDAQD